MAKRRTLKRAINELGADLLVELMSTQHINPRIAADDVKNIAQSIVVMQADFISRLSHVDKRQVRRFFRQLEDDLNVCTNEIIDQIYHLI